MDYNRVADQIKDITQGKMADVVLNSLGIETWESSSRQNNCLVFDLSLPISIISSSFNRVSYGYTTVIDS